MPDPLGMRIVSKDLSRLALEAKLWAPEIRRAMPKRLREAGQVIKDEAERRKPSQKIKLGIRTSLAKRGANVKVVAKSPENPPEAGLLEAGSKRSGGRVIRHPVFGRNPRIDQPTKPYLKPAGKAKASEAARKLAGIDADIARMLRLR